MTTKEPPYYHLLLAAGGALIGRLFKLVESAFHEYVIQKLINWWNNRKTKNG